MRHKDCYPPGWLQRKYVAKLHLRDLCSTCRQKQQPENNMISGVQTSLTTSHTVTSSGGKPSCCPNWRRSASAHSPRPQTTSASPPWAVLAVQAGLLAGLEPQAHAAQSPPVCLWVCKQVTSKALSARRSLRAKVARNSFVVLAKSTSAHMRRRLVAHTSWYSIIK